jgi:DNA-binding transcriptional LysR family regulator
MDLRQIRYFLAIAEHGGFTPAAASLHIAQPSLSHAVRALERELGSELFLRHPKGVALTAAGEALLGPARRIVRDFEVAKDAVNDVLGLAGGRLAVVAVPWVAVNCLAALVGELRRQHPGVTCTITEADDDRELAGMVVDGTCELGFVFAPPGGSSFLERNNLAYHVLGFQEYWLVQPPGTLDDPNPIALSELQDVPWVVPPAGVTTRDAVELMLGTFNVRVDEAVIVDTREALLPLVLAGAGVTMLSREEADVAAQRGAVIRPITPPLRRSYGVLHREGALSPAAKLLCELATARARRATGAGAP